MSSQDLKLDDTKRKVDEITDIMRKNIHKALDNSEQIQDLEIGSEDLLRQAADFDRSSKELKRKYMWQRIRQILIIFIILAICIAIIVLVTKH